MNVSLLPSRLVVLAAFVCSTTGSLHAMTLAEREKLELKQASAAAMAKAKAARAAEKTAEPVAPREPATPRFALPYGINQLPEQFVQKASGNSSGAACGCSAYAPSRDLIFSGDTHQGVLYQHGRPNFLPHLLAFDNKGVSSNWYGTTDLRIRTNLQRTDPAACLGYQPVRTGEYCGEGSLDVVIDNQTQKPIKTMFICHCG